MDEQEAEVGCYKHHWDRIHSYEYDLLWSCLVVETLQWVVCTHDEYHYDSLWQPREDSIVEESRIRWLLQQIDIRYCLIWDMVSRWARRLHHIETDVQDTDILTKPRGKVKSVIFLNDLELLRELLIRVLNFFRALSSGSSKGLGVLTGATYDHRATHIPWWYTMYRMTGSTFACDTPWWLWNRMISSPVGRDD